MALGGSGRASTSSGGGVEGFSGIQKPLLVVWPMNVPCEPRSQPCTSITPMSTPTCLHSLSTCCVYTSCLNQVHTRLQPFLSYMQARVDQAKYKRGVEVGRHTWSEVARAQPAARSGTSTAGRGLKVCPFHNPFVSSWLASSSACFTTWMPAPARHHTVGGSSRSSSSNTHVEFETMIKRRAASVQDP